MFWDSCSSEKSVLTRCTCRTCSPSGSTGGTHVSPAATPAPTPPQRTSSEPCIWAGPFPPAPLEPPHLSALPVSLRLARETLPDHMPAAYASRITSSGSCSPAASSSSIPNAAPGAPQAKLVRGAVADFAARVAKAKLKLRPRVSAPTTPATPSTSPPAAARAPAEAVAARASAPPPLTVPASSGGGARPAPSLPASSLRVKLAVAGRPMTADAVSRGPAATLMQSQVAACLRQPQWVPQRRQGSHPLVRGVPLEGLRPGGEALLKLAQARGLRRMGRGFASCAARCLAHSWVAL